MKNYICLFLMCCMALPAWGQGLYSANHFLNNPFGLNPAYAGYAQGTDVALQVRSAWSDVRHAPATALLTAHTHLGKNVGIGGRALSDQRGLFNTFHADLAATYKVPLTDGFLQMGLNMGVIQSRIRGNLINANRFVDPTDPVLFLYDESRLAVGAAALFALKGVELGVAVPNLLDQGNQLFNRPAIVTATYKYALNSQFSVQPVAVWQSVRSQGSIWDASMRLCWKDTFWVQGGYRSSAAVLVSAGVQLGDLRVGYLYEGNTGALQHLAVGGHEIMVGLRLGKTSAPVPDSPAGL